MPTKELWRRLMHDELGFLRYAARCGDLAGEPPVLLNQAHPEAVAGIHLLAVADPIDYDPGSVTSEGQNYRDAVSLRIPDRTP